MLGIGHSYRSHVSNKVVMETANLRIRLKRGQTIKNMSDKLKDRQIKFYGTPDKVGRRRPH